MLNVPVSLLIMLGFFWIVSYILNSRPSKPAPRQYTTGPRVRREAARVGEEQAN